jgi:hypothetical protein
MILRETFFKNFVKNVRFSPVETDIYVEGKIKTKEQAVEKTKTTKTLNLRWGELGQDDKEALARVARERPEWARIFLFGETRIGSREETEALLRCNDGLSDALFIQTWENTIRMRAYDNAVARLLVPHSQYRAAWKEEERRLGASGLDEGVDFIFAVYDQIMRRADGNLVYPYRKFGKPLPSWEEGEDARMMYLGAWMLFRKAHFLDLSLTRFFALLPDNWLGSLSLRELDSQEAALALSVGRKHRRLLANGEINAVRLFEQNSKKQRESKEGIREFRPGPRR